MNPPARPLRTEVNEAVVGGIRQRGPEATGLVIVGLARLFLAVLFLAVMLLAMVVLGFSVTPIPVGVMSVLSGLGGWATIRPQRWDISIDANDQQA